LQTGATVAEESGLVGEGLSIREKTSELWKKYRVASAVENGVRRRRRRRKTRRMGMSEGCRKPSA
jgi:hypothetical protein